MSSVSSSPSAFSRNKSFKQDVIRNTMKFSPSIWGDQFLIFNERKDLACEEQRAKELKEKVRKELVIKGSIEPTQHMKLLELIDAVQRLGVAYHFEDEIEECLKHIYVTYGDKWINENNLVSTSLQFRLLRQQGFNVSSVIFYKYKNQNGNFLESLRDDIHGMLSLYEATYMRVEGEEILDEALEFTKYHLGNILEKHICSNDASLESQIYQALQQPLRKRLPRLEALRYIPIYEQQDSRNDDLLTLAKLDFNLLQELHRKELSQISKWWNNLDVLNKLPYTRDRIVEGYFWILAVYFEPQHSESRFFLMKMCNLMILFDDTYDNYGTYEELQIFTEAIQKWSISCLDMLPEYMKLIYQEILDVYKEAEDLLEKKGNTYRISYTKELVKEYTRSLLIEAKWNTCRFPLYLLANGYYLVIMLSYVHRDDLVVTEDTFKWLSNYPPIVKASCFIFRLMNDMAKRKDERERNHMASSVECYMKQYRVSEEHTHELFSKLLEDNWKVINKESLRPIDIPRSLLMPPINFARVSEILYTGGDNYTHAGKEMIDYIKSLLVNPISTFDVSNKLPYVRDGILDAYFWILVRKDQACEEQQIKELKEKVRKELVIARSIEPTQHMKLLQLIDSIQRLGVAYHFEDEIEECLKHIYAMYGDQWINDDNLQSTSLWFRLLRQQGFNVSSGIFNKYKNENGNFLESLSVDIHGMLSLYEATHMRVQGEDVLDEALEFTKYHLRNIIEKSICGNDVSLETQIHQALQQPLRQRLPRLETLRYIPIYQQQDSRNDDLLTLAKLDFNLLQELHRKELSQISKWSISCLDMLPEYMKPIYQELLDVHKEAEDFLEKTGKAYRSYYTKEMVKEYTRNLLIEAKWANERYIPTVEEHMSVTLVTCAYAMIIAKCYVHGDDSVTEDTFKWVSTYPPIVKASCLILRLMDDMATHKEEQERNHVASSVECYMKQYGLSEEQTHELFTKLVEDSWKVINQESLRPTEVPRSLLMPPINLARVCDVLYARGDDYNHAGIEMITHIKSLLVNPLSPLRKRLPRLEALRYIPIYQQQDSRNDDLLTLAKLDFNLLQELHRKELSQISKWSISCLDMLPEYMKLIYQELLDVYKEAEDLLAKKGNTYRISYIKE
ncbi:hypothetical protein M8C21_024270, partial [Ambrosia artemisiifolia]